MKIEKHCKEQCVICHGDIEKVFSVDHYPIVECQACSHRMTRSDELELHVENNYSDEYFFDGGAGYSNYLAESDLLIKRGENYAKLLARYFPTCGTVLDVGCASGFILQGFRNHGWKVEGVEPNPTMAEYAVSKLGIDVMNKTIEGINTDKTYDLICLIQVIAHFREPREVIQKILKCLKPGGYVLVETWNYKSLQARLFGKSWHEYSPPTVLQWFNLKSLDTLFEKYHFKTISFGRPSKRIQWAHARSLISYKIGDNFLMNIILKILNLVPDNFSIPYPAGDLFYKLYQKEK